MKAAPARYWAQPALTCFQQPIAPCRQRRLFDPCQWQAGAFDEQAGRNALVEAQRIHHEFPGQIVRRDVLPGSDEFAARRRVQVGEGMAAAGFTPDAFVVRELAVGPGTDAQVVAKSPAT